MSIRRVSGNELARLMQPAPGAADLLEKEIREAEGYLREIRERAQMVEVQHRETQGRIRAIEQDLRWLRDGERREAAVLTHLGVQRDRYTYIAETLRARLRGLGR